MNAAERLASIAEITITLAAEGKALIRATLGGRFNAGGPYCCDAELPREVARLVGELRAEHAAGTSEIGLPTWWGPS